MRLLLFCYVFFALACKTTKELPVVDLTMTDQTAIIVDVNAPKTVQLAARELQYYLGKLYDIEVPIMNNPEADSIFYFYVGESAYTKTLGFKIDQDQDDSYRIFGNSQYLVLVGNDQVFMPRGPYAMSGNEVEAVLKRWHGMVTRDWDNPLKSIYRHYSKALGIWEYDHCGSLQAVYGYLRLLGIRWYMPGDLGEVMPLDITDPKLTIDTLVTPIYPVRNQYHLYKNFFMASRDEVLYRYRLGLNSGSKFLGHGSPGHGINNILNSEVLKREHPEYFGEIDGRRVTQGTKILPCLSQTGLVEEAADYVRAVFDIYDEPVTSLMPPDGFTQICQCSLCQDQVAENRGEQGKYSDYVWSFVNKVAKKVKETHPEKKILCFAYTTYLLPPERMDRLNSNVLVGICRTRATFQDPKIDSLYAQLSLQWYQKCSDRKLIFWDYYLHSRPANKYYAAPVIFLETITSDLRRSSTLSLGEFVEVSRTLDEVDPLSIASNHLNIFLTAQLYWNPNQDTRKILEEYYRNFYLDVHKEMKHFFEFSERNWRIILNDPILIDSAFTILNDALSKTKHDIVVKRINLILQYISPLSKIKERLSRDQLQTKSRTFRVINRARNAVILDGSLDDGLWSDLHPYQFYFLSKAVANKYRRIKSSVRFAARGNVMFMGFDIAKMEVGTPNRDKKMAVDSDLDERDHLRININPLEGPVYTIMLGLTGGVLVYMNNALQENVQSGIDVKIKETPDHYVLEMSIPIGNAVSSTAKKFSGILSQTPTESYPWYINIFLTQYTKDGNKIDAAIFYDEGSDIPADRQFAKIIYR